MNQPTIDTVKLFATDQRFGHTGVPLVGLTSEDGYTGLGEINSVPAEQALNIIEHYLAHLIPAPVFSRESLWQDMTTIARDFDREPATIASIIAAIDAAIWDLAAQHAQRPCWAIASGAGRKRLEIAVKCGKISTACIDTAKTIADSGILTFSFDIPQPDETSFRLLREARNALGTQTLITANVLEPAQSVERAIAIGDELDRAVPYWISGLLPDGRWHQLATVREQLDSAIAAGSNVVGLRPFFAALRADSAEIITPRLEYIAGPTAATKLAHAAELRTIRCAINPGKTIASALTAAHVCFATAHTYPLPLTQPLIECIQAVPNMALQDGLLQLPTEAGIGIPAKWHSKLETIATVSH